MQILDEANSYLAVLCNWSPMSIKTNHWISLQLGWPGHLNTCHQSVPFCHQTSPCLPTKFPSTYLNVLLCFLIATLVTKLSWNNPSWSFYSDWPGGKLLKVGCTYVSRMKCNQTTCNKGCSSSTLWCFTCTLFFNKAMINTYGKPFHPLMTSLNVS